MKERKIDPSPIDGVMVTLLPPSTALGAVTIDRREEIPGEPTEQMDHPRLAGAHSRATSADRWRICDKMPNDRRSTNGGLPRRD